MEQKKKHSSYLPAKFWKSDLSLTYLLFFLMITVFVIYPIPLKGIFSKFLFSFFVGLSFLSGIFSITHKLKDRALAMGISLFLLVIGFIIFKINSITGDIIYIAILIIYLSALAGLLLKEIFSDDKINLHRIQGAIAVYILFALIFSFAYRIVFMVDPGSFHFGNMHSDTDIVDPFEFLYFSFIILTTMGYGLIVPVGHYAQSLVMFEALIGILFPSILISRLVSLVSFNKKV